MAYLLVFLLLMGTAEAAYIPTTPVATATAVNTPTPQATDTPLAFGTPGVIPVFGSPELQPFAGSTCPTPQIAIGINSSGGLSCVTPVPTATPLPTSTPQTLPTVRFFWVSNTANNNVSVVSTQYMTVSGNQSANNTEAVTDNAAPQAFTVKNLHCQTHNIQPGVGASYVLTFRKNAADTALTCTIADTAVDCSDNTHTVSVAQDDFFAYSVAPVNSPANTPMHCGLEVDP